VLVSAVFFLAALPFARTPLAQLPAFIPICVASLVILDLIAAVDALLQQAIGAGRNRVVFSQEAAGPCGARQSWIQYERPTRDLPPS